MKTIDLQNKTSPYGGRSSCYWFENLNIGLKNTLFYRIQVFLTPFESGFDFVDQPENTEIILEFINLNSTVPMAPENFSLNLNNETECDGSIYVGCSHNPVDIVKLKTKPVSGNKFILSGTLFIDFEYEGIAKNEQYSFEAEIEYTGLN